MNDERIGVQGTGYRITINQLLRRPDQYRDTFCSLCCNVSLPLKALQYVEVKIDTKIFEFCYILIFIFSPVSTPFLNWSKIQFCPE